MIYYFLAFVSGMIVVFNIIFNSRLAKKTDIYLSTFANYLIALLTAGIFVLLMNEKLLYVKDIRFIYYSGGMIGVFVVVIFNTIVHRIPVMYSTILSFIGQLAMGIVLDLLLNNPISFGKVAGLVLILSGLLFNMNIDNRLKRKNSKKPVNPSDPMVQEL